MFCYNKVYKFTPVNSLYKENFEYMRFWLVKQFSM